MIVKRIESITKGGRMCYSTYHKPCIQQALWRGSYSRIPLQRFNVGQGSEADVFFIFQVPSVKRAGG